MAQDCLCTTGRPAFFIDLLIIQPQNSSVLYVKYVSYQSIHRWESVRKCLHLSMTPTHYVSFYDEPQYFLDQRIQYTFVHQQCDVVITSGNHLQCQFCWPSVAYICASRFRACERRTGTWNIWMAASINTEACIWLRETSWRYELALWTGVMTTGIVTAWLLDIDSYAGWNRLPLGRHVILY